MTQRCATANAPIVAAITNKHGDPLSQPVRRDTACTANAVVSTVAENLVRVRVPVDALYDRNANR